MKILAIDRHYWPDANPYARILKSIADELAAAGHEVTVFTAQPSYNDIRQPRRPWRERASRVVVHRIGLLPERKRMRILWLANCLYFLGRAILHATIVAKYDLVIGATAHPILSALALRIIRLLRGTPYVVHAQDIHPEAAACVGLISRGWFYRGLQLIDRWSHSGAARVIAIGEDQRSYLQTRGGGSSDVPLAVIHNPPLELDASTPSVVPPVYAELVARHPNATRVVFAGNLGNFQALDQIAEAAELLAYQPEIQFVFIGEGLAKNRLALRLAHHLGRTVHFIPHQPVESAFAIMREAALGIVSLHPGMYHFAFPSKTMMYLAAGCPLLVVMEKESELAQLVARHRVGVVADACDGQSIASVIRRHRRQSRSWSELERQRIQHVGQRLFGLREMQASWRQLINEMDRAEHRRAA